jgi:hypothetical protein
MGQIALRATGLNRIEVVDAKLENHGFIMQGFE